MSLDPQVYKFINDTFNVGKILLYVVCIGMGLVVLVPILFFFLLILF